MVKGGLTYHYQCAAAPICTVAEKGHSKCKCHNRNTKVHNTNAKCHNMNAKATTEVSVTPIV